MVDHEEILFLPVTQISEHIWVYKQFFILKHLAKTGLFLLKSFFSFWKTPVYVHFVSWNRIQDTYKALFPQLASWTVILQYFSLFFENYLFIMLHVSFNTLSFRDFYDKRSSMK